MPSRGASLTNRLGEPTRLDRINPAIPRDLVTIVQGDIFKADLSEADLSDVRANVNVASGLVEHRTHGITIRNRSVLGNYDRFYQNFVPGAATADQSQVALTSATELMK